MKSNYKRLGQYIRPVDIRNIDERVKLLLGVSIEKKFIESIANILLCFFLEKIPLFALSKSYKIEGVLCFEWTN